MSYSQSLQMLLAFTLLGGCALPTYLGTSNPAPEPIDTSIEEQLDADTRIALYEQIIGEVAVPEHSQYTACKVDLANKQATLYNDLDLSLVYYPLQDVSLHLIGDSADGKPYFVNLIKPRGQGVATGDVCFLFLSSNKQSPAEQQRNISIAASVLHSFGVEVLPKYRRAALETDQHMPITAWLSHGEGETIQLPNGDTFVGVSLNGTPFGQGTLIKPNGDVYLGNFKDGELDGGVEVIVFGDYAVAEGSGQDFFLFGVS